MHTFQNEGLTLSFLDEGEPAGDPVLLIHGFGSNKSVNWIGPGWVKTLGDAGYRVLAFDNRGHGESDKPYAADAYTPERMASDAAAILDHVAVERAHVIGYSMGARVAAFMSLSAAERVRSVIFGGLGAGMVTGLGGWEGIESALLADSIEDVDHPRGRMFRAFAEQTGGDRIALAACIRTSRKILSEKQMASITMPALVAVGTRDDIAGSAHELAATMPNAQALDIPGRDHMLAVGDKVFKAGALEFLASNH